MKAIFYKELRENLAWAGIILLATAGALITGLYNEFGMGMSILGRTFLTLCILVYPAAGLAMGLLQVFQDSRRGRWQFITHRPMSVTQYLSAKWAAGMLLYFLATGIPLVLVIAWVAAPGHVPGPFEWDMTEPVIAHLLSGLMWYAGGFLVAGRSARWFGSRVIPIGGAVAGAFAYNFFAITLIEAIGMIVLVTAIILFAAWGVFVGGGETSNSPKWTRPACGLCLFAGWVVVLALTMGFCAQAIETAWPTPQPPNSQYHFDSDGNVQIWTYTKYETRQEDLAGHELHVDEPRKTLLPIATLFFPNEKDSDLMGRRSEPSFLHPESHLISVYGTGGKESWFFLRKSRTVKGYYPDTHWYIGSIGPNGFLVPQSTAQAFEESTMLESRDLFSSPNSVYQLATALRKVQKVYSATLSNPVQSAANLVIPNDLKTGDADYLVATRSAFRIVHNNKTVLVVPISQIQASDYITAGVTRANQFILASGLQEEIGYTNASYSVFNMDGSLARHTVLPSKALDTGYRRDDRVAQYSVLSLSPPGFFAVVLPLKQRPGDPFPWEPVGILLVASIGWAGVMFARLRARHATGSQMFVRLLLAACLGLTGVLLEMSMLKSVRSVRCLKCGKRRLNTELRCGSCAAEVEGPGMEGIEIFAGVGG